MITVARAVEESIRKSPFLEEALFDGLMNISALARRIQPDIEKQIGKKITQGAVVMAINRLSPSNFLKIQSSIPLFISALGDIVVRSGLSDYTFLYSDDLTKKQTELLKLIQSNKDVFCTFSQGVSERCIILSTSLCEKMEDIFQDETILSKKENLSSLTIRLPQNNVEIPGVYYFILKNLAWEGINLVEIISTTNEFTLIVNNGDVDKTFTLLMKLKNGQY